MISQRAEKGRKSSKLVTKSKQVATDKKQINVRKWADKNTKNILNQLARDTQLNKVFRLVPGFQKWSLIYFKGILY